jgi:cation diffusion facilitator CzcD-associated flavoprotein CzcO
LQGSDEQGQLLSYIHTIVIDGGQAGLAVGYRLKKRGIPFLIVDVNERIGDAWRNRRVLIGYAFRPMRSPKSAKPCITPRFP